MKQLLTLLALILSSAVPAQEGSSPKKDVTLFYEAFNGKDPTLLHRILSEKWVDIPPAPGQPPGPEGAKQILVELTTAFPDLAIKIEEVLQDGAKVIVRSEISGTQRNALMGFPAKNRRMVIQAIDIHEFEDGKILRTWHTEDWMTGFPPAWNSWPVGRLTYDDAGCWRRSMTISLILKPRLHDLGGGMLVRRLLPAAAKQGIGPFVFFDHLGPIEVRPEDNHDVRPHPHIGIATVTYLFEGAIVHRDSIGCTQRIEPGAINWMTAGRGVVHSERRPEDMRTRAYTNHGLQLWAALPAGSEEVEPAFVHTPGENIPALELQGARVRVLIGSAFGLISPVVTFQPTLYVDVRAQPGGSIEIERSDIERAVYSVDERLIIDNRVVEPRTLAVLERGTGAHLAAPDGARYVVIGGEPLDSRRHMWWNFVSSRKERIEEAKRAWTAQLMGTIPGEIEWIPLPA
jgi:hypothetical protein